MVAMITFTVAAFVAALSSGADVPLAGMNPSAVTILTDSESLTGETADSAQKTNNTTANAENATSSADESSQDVEDNATNASSLPVAVYCNAFDINSVPVKVKVVIKNETHADIYGEVYGFAMYCIDQEYKLLNKTIEMIAAIDEHGKLTNCLAERFAGVDEDLNMVTIAYKADEGVLSLTGASIPSQDLLPNKDCISGDSYKAMNATLMDLKDMEVRRRLSDVLYNLLSRRNDIFV